jgi:hypothetical protein
MEPKRFLKKNLNLKIALIFLIPKMKTIFSFSCIFLSVDFFQVLPIMEYGTKEDAGVGWANIRHIFNIRIMNIFDLLFEYSNIIRSNILCYIL